MHKRVLEEIIKQGDFTRKEVERHEELLKSTLLYKMIEMNLAFSDLKKEVMKTISNFKKNK